MTNDTMYFNCMAIEELVRSMVMRGIDDNFKLVMAVNKEFEPQTAWEQELYSEAIIYAKQGVLN
jgi:hypothetical protein